jgi:hypothetical protein
VSVGSLCFAHAVKYTDVYVLVKRKKSGAENSWPRSPVSKRRGLRRGWRLELSRSYGLLGRGASLKVPVAVLALPTIRTDLFVALEAQPGLVLGHGYFADADLGASVPPMPLTE